MDRVIVYIDGFNLYFGLKSKGWRRYFWLNPQRLTENLLKPGQKLVFTKYFTARVSNTHAIRASTSARLRSWRLSRPCLIRASTTATTCRNRKLASNAGQHGMRMRRR